MSSLQCLALRPPHCDQGLRGRLSFGTNQLRTAVDISMSGVERQCQSSQGLNSGTPVVQYTLPQERGLNVVVGTLSGEKIESRRQALVDACKRPGEASAARRCMKLGVDRLLWWADPQDHARNIHCGSSGCFSTDSPSDPHARKTIISRDSFSPALAVLGRRQVQRLPKYDLRVVGYHCHLIGSLSGLVQALRARKARNNIVTPTSDQGQHLHSNRACQSSIVSSNWSGTDHDRPHS